MTITIADHSGYCYGVQRAFKLIAEAADRGEGNLYTLGPIIHNPQAVERLKEEKAVVPVSDLAEIPEGTVIIRTHGVPPEIIERAEAKGLDVVDCTCPFVEIVQRKAKALVGEGYGLFIVGEKSHPEVVGILGHADGCARIVEEAEEVQELSEIPDRIGVVVQTTQEVERLQRVISELLPKCRELKVHNTICRATEQRQSSARELAEEVDLMLVVGGRNSGNTRRLFSVCRDTSTPCFHIETAAEIDPAWLEGTHRVGITAGASTPDFIIEEVVRALESSAQEEEMGCP